MVARRKPRRRVSHSPQGETLSHRLAAATAPFSRGLGGRPKAAPTRCVRDAAPHKKGVYCTTQARCKQIEPPIPEIEESGSE